MSFCLNIYYCCIVVVVKLTLFDSVRNIYSRSVLTFAEERTELCYALILYLRLHIFALCQFVRFLMLYNFVVSLCVTPQVHASWRGVC